MKREEGTKLNKGRERGAVTTACRRRGGRRKGALMGENEGPGTGFGHECAQGRQSRLNRGFQGWRKVKKDHSFWGNGRIPKGWGLPGHLNKCNWYRNMEKNRKHNATKTGRRSRLIGQRPWRSRRGRGRSSLSVRAVKNQINGAEEKDLEGNTKTQHQGKKISQERSG